MPGQLLVESTCAFGEGSEERVSGGEANACADGCDVVQMVPGSFEFEQNRAHTCELATRTQPKCLFAGMRIGDGVRDCARGAGALRIGETVLERVFLRRPLETAVFVEEPRVDVQDPFSDHVEAKVSRLDHAGVDRSDRHLVCVIAANGDRPVRELEIVLDERSLRFVAVEGICRTGRQPRARPSRRPR